jgi:hypothetical protein
MARGIATVEDAHDRRTRVHGSRAALCQKKIPTAPGARSHVQLRRITRMLHGHILLGPRPAGISRACKKQRDMQATAHRRIASSRVSAPLGGPWAGLELRGHASDPAVERPAGGMHP